MMTLIKTKVRGHKM